MLNDHNIPKLSTVYMNSTWVLLECDKEPVHQVSHILLLREYLWHMTIPVGLYYLLILLET